MYDFMMEIEMAMFVLCKIASTVVENACGGQGLKPKTKWIAEVEINIISKILALPKVVEGKSVTDQETELREQFATFIASKLLELLSLGNQDLHVQTCLIFQGTRIFWRRFGNFWMTQRLKGKNV